MINQALSKIAARFSGHREVQAPGGKIDQESMRNECVRQGEIPMSEVCQRLKSLKRDGWGDDELGRLLAERLPKEASPAQFFLTGALLINDLRKGVDGTTGNPIVFNPTLTPSETEHLLAKFEGSLVNIARRVCPRDFARQVSKIAGALDAVGDKYFFLNKPENPPQEMIDAVWINYAIKDCQFKGVHEKLRNLEQFISLVVADTKEFGGLLADKLPADPTATGFCVTAFSLLDDLERGADQAGKPIKSTLAGLRTPIIASMLPDIARVVFPKDKAEEVEQIVKDALEKRRAAA